MTEPAYPIFIFEGLDFFLVSSDDKLQTALEPDDVKSTIYAAYDSKARRVQLGATRWRITAVINPDEPIARGEFQIKLRAFLRAVGDPCADDPACTLDCLMDACKRRG